MTAETDPPAAPGTEASTPRTSRSRTVVLLVVVALFAGVALAKLIAPEADRPASNGSSLTTVHNDAVADYAAARRSGRPIYVLFHSLS